MSTKPKKIKELKKQEDADSNQDTPEKGLSLGSMSGIFFILLYALGVYTNLRTGNYLMAGVWFILIGVNLFFIVRNRKRKK
ncbi:hypothetical protein [Streptococcus oriscaviae]|uniref:LPXTG cell wall anchor domain-containing protein n=1 Tax=Streptococcus oriscaviae TaxID=2781599 RepID=A0ABX7YQC6_9STRE|nr:hypothetical protein [Streptococcus oriscaviae]QUE55434.1 hypothetical protein INT76_00900 [Streptococcus oriscaviae]